MKVKITYQTGSFQCIINLTYETTFWLDLHVFWKKKVLTEMKQWGNWWSKERLKNFEMRRIQMNDHGFEKLFGEPVDMGRWFTIMHM